MSEPLKPRIDFDGPLQAEKIPPLKGARAFDTLEADNFAPARLVTGEEEEGAAEAVVESVLRPKRSLWRRMDSVGLAIFGVSVVAQGVQWTANAWQTQDWIALGGCVAGALIVGAGVGSLATEGAVCGDCASAPTNAMKRAICCTVTRSVKRKPFVRSWRSRPGWISRIRRCSAGMPRSTKRKATVKW